MKNVQIIQSWQSAVDKLLDYIWRHFQDWIRLSNFRKFDFDPQPTIWVWRLQTQTVTINWDNWKTIYGVVLKLQVNVWVCQTQTLILYLFFKNFVKN